MTASPSEQEAEHVLDVLLRCGRQAQQLIGFVEYQHTVHETTEIASNCVGKTRTCETEKEERYSCFAFGALLGRVLKKLIEEVRVPGRTRTQLVVDLRVERGGVRVRAAVHADNGVRGGGAALVLAQQLVDRGRFARSRRADDEQTPSALAGGDAVEDGGDRGLFVFSTDKRELSLRAADAQERMFSASSGASRLSTLESESTSSLVYDSARRMLGC